MADQEPHCACPEIKVDSEANGFTETTSSSRPFPKRKLAVALEQFLIFYLFIFTQSLGAYLTYLGAYCELNWRVYTPTGVQFSCLLNKDQLVNKEHLYSGDPLLLNTEQLVNKEHHYSGHPILLNKKQLEHKEHPNSCHPILLAFGQR